MSSRWSWLLGWVLWSCGEHSAPIHHGPDTQAHDAATAIADEPDLDTWVVTLLSEYDRGIDITCPCRVEQHTFVSIEECKSLLVQLSPYAKCATRTFMTVDGPELRAALRCRVQETVDRNACLDSHPCVPEFMNECYQVTRDCPFIDGHDVSDYVYACTRPTESEADSP